MMIFTKTLDSDTRRDWLSDCGHYRISYYNTIPQCNHLPSHNRYKPAYYALVKRATAAGTVWCHAHKHGPFWSYASAEKACRSNRSWWKRLFKAESAAAARQLILASRVGTTRRGGHTHQTTRILAHPPTWVEAILPKRLRRLLPNYARPRKRNKAILA